MNDEIMSCPQIKESDLHYLGGVCDVWGSVRVEGQNTKCPYPLIVFKSPFRDTLEAIRKASGGLGSLPEQPTAPSKNQVRPHYSLRFRGAHYYLFENMVLPHMRVEAKIARFAENRQKLMGLRREFGLTSPFRLPTSDEDAARLSW